MTLEGHICCLHIDGITYEVDIAVAVFGTCIQNCWIYMPILHNGCISHICNVASIFFSGMSNLCTVTEE